MRVWLAL
jgi:hypothetical protein